MTTEAKTGMTIFDRVTDPIDAIERLGTMLAKSRMFGCQTIEQGQVLAMACLAERRNPIEIKRTYHLVDGDLSMRADAMLAELRNRGGSHKRIDRTDKVAEIEVSYKGETIRERLTWDEARAEPWPFRKDGKTLKKNWATPRARRQMLWARVVSESVRTIAPEIVAGVYTPEESGDYDAGDNKAPDPVDVEQLMRETADADQETNDEPIDAEFQVVDSGPDTPEPDEPPAEHKVEVEVQAGEMRATSDSVAMSTVEQRKQLRDLFDGLGATDVQVNKALAKRDAKSFRDLTADQAAELIDALEAKAKAAADQTAGESRLPTDATSSDVTGPVTQGTIDQIKSLMAGDFETAKRVKEHLNSNGKQKLAELSQADGDLLLKCLEAKATEEFFAKSLEKPPF